MNKQYFMFSKTEGELTIHAGINLSDVMHFVQEGDKLFVLLREQRETLEPREVPVLKGTGKNRTIAHEVQVRNAKDFFTIIIDDKERIEVFMNYMKELSI